MKAALNTGHTRLACHGHRSALVFPVFGLFQCSAVRSALHVCPPTSPPLMDCSVTSLLYLAALPVAHVHPPHTLPRSPICPPNQCPTSPEQAGPICLPYSPDLRRRATHSDPPDPIFFTHLAPGPICWPENAQLPIRLPPIALTLPPPLLPCVEGRNPLLSLSRLVCAQSSRSPGLRPVFSFAWCVLSGSWGVSQ